MNRNTLAMLLAFGFLSTSPVAAKEGSLFDFGACLPNCISKYCCDDYCPKPVPEVRKNCRYSCDDYFPKPLPCARPVRCFRCDDYCPKPLPPIHCPCNQGLSCGRSE
jgi:hypothetical protein